MRIVLALVAILLVARVAYPQTPSTITTPIDNSARTALVQSHLPFLSRTEDLGPLNESQALTRMVLLLKQSPAKQQALTGLLASQQTKGSPDYRAWLTPDEFGRRFGPSSDDLAQVTGWLQQQGFQIDTVARSGMWIEFSGTAGHVNAAFQTQMHGYQINGKSHIANSSDLSIPAALAPVLEGVPLNDLFSEPMLAHRQTPQGPQITAPWNGAHAIIPGDFASVYDLNPLYKAGLNGSSQTIAIVAESDIDLSDVATFQKIFGLPANPPVVIDVGADPGEDTTQGYGLEATVDTEWSSAVAPGAAIDLVVSASSQTTDGVALSALYIVDQNLAQIVSLSYGECEQDLGTAGNAMWNSLWQQAAAQGMSVFVASGDQGSVACNASGLNLFTGYGPMSVNGLASTPFNTAVGGTEFDEGENGGSVSTFWNTTNASNLSSVTGYIPEMVWNDSCDDNYNIYVFQECSSTLPSLAAGGGGVSTVYAMPPWQTLSVTGLNVLSGYSLPNQTGVSPRGLPDVALDASADHDGYLLCFTTQPATPDCQLINGAITQTTFQNELGGTSFGAPEFAGIMAIVNQAEKSANPSPSPSPVTDGRQGLATYTLYALAAAETFSGCNASNRTNPSQGALAGCTFNDITFGNNGPPQSYTWAPGVGGYAATTGYDLASGLGSVDAHNLIANWTSAGASFHGSQTTLTSNAGTNTISIQHGQPVPFDVTVQKLSGDATTQTPSGDISLIARGGSLQGSAGVASETLTAAASGSATTGYFSVGALPAGSYNVAANFPGDGTFAASASDAISVKVTPENSDTTINVAANSQGYGTPVEFQVQAAGASGQGYPSGTVTLADGGTTFATIPLSSNGQASLITCVPPGGYFPPLPTLPCFSAGTHQFSASYSGDTSFNPSPTPPAASQLASVVIAKGNLEYLSGEDLAINPASNGVPINAPVTVTATMLANPLGPPTGAVQLSLNSAALGQPVPLTQLIPGDAYFQANFTGVTVPQGNFTLGASYSGDSNYTPLTISAPSSWGVPLGWIAQTISATVNPGQTATFNLTLSNSSFIGQSAIVCTPGTWNQSATPPAGVACSVSPAMVNLTSASQTVPVVVTITTTQQSRLDRAPFRTLPFTLPPVFALVLWGIRKRRWHTTVGCIAAVLAIAAMSSCGGGQSSGSTGQTGPPATTAQFTVWATMNTTGSVTSNGNNAITVTANINQ
jgi:hypothetical protein